MTCPTRDPDLLLLAHGALPMWRRLRAQAHLRRCPECRQRLASLMQVSSLLAGAIRAPGMPPWSHAQAASRAALGSPQRLIALVSVLWTMLWITLIALVCLIALLWRGVFPNAFGRTVPRPSSATDGCRPDLPNSRCR